MSKHDDAKDGKKQEASDQVTAAQATARREMKKIEKDWSPEKLRNLF